MKKGFSLVELSIVLVILGLLVGGILAGRSLIHAAELRAVTTQFQRYNTALYAFRDKYMALPGDMRNAFAFWGTTSGCLDADVATDVNGCNGNGDGKIFSSNEGESARAWQHLANAGLIEGQYPGIRNVLPNTYTPLSPLRGGRWALKHWPLSTHGWVNAPVVSANMFYHGGVVIPVEDAWNIDTKMDDGKATGGFVFAHTTGNCVTSTDWPTAAYNLGTDGRCDLLIMLR